MDKLDKEDAIPTDRKINPSRSRLGRLSFLGAYTALTGYGVSTFTYNLITLPFKNEAGEVTNQLITGLATGSSLIAALSLLFFTIPKRFLISNKPNRMFVTQNVLASFFGSDEINIAYGPGTHPCYPWEKRIEANNISLEEATVEFDFTVTLKDGSLTGKGAYWLRPDHTEPVRFLRGVASVGEEIKTLIIAQIQKYIASEDFRKENVSASDTSRITGLVNKELERQFGDNNDHKKQELEERNGVIVSNAAIESFQVSTELNKTITGIAEARAVQMGTALLLGFANDNEMADALKKGALGQEDVARARRDFLSISGNFDGMTVQRNELDLSIRGLSPEVANMIAELAKTPAAQAAVVAATRSRGGANQGKQTK